MTLSAAKQHSVTMTRTQTRRSPDTCAVFLRRVVASARGLQRGGARVGVSVSVSVSVRVRVGVS
jgi:hypothetical protein